LCSLGQDNTGFPLFLKRIFFSLLQWKFEVHVFSLILVRFLHVSKSP
jgi:hypothetical protein